MQSGQGQEQTAGTGSIMVTTVFRVYGVTDMPAIHDEVVGISDSQLDPADIAIQPNFSHLKLISGDVVYRGVSRIFLIEDELKVAVDHWTGVMEDGHQQWIYSILEEVRRLFYTIDSDTNLLW